MNRITFATVLAVLAASCSSAGRQAGDGIGLVFAPVVEEGECRQSPAGTHTLPAEIGWLVIRLIDGTGAVAKLVVAGSPEVETGSLVVKGVQPGEYRLEILGCQADPSGARAIWRGERTSVLVSENAKSLPVIFMLRGGALACIGGQNTNGTAPGFKGADFLAQGRTGFGSVLATEEGRVFVTGGFTSRTFRPPSSDELGAGTKVWEFLPEAGVFIPVAGASGTGVALAEPRAMHGTIPLGGDMLAVVGGAKTVLLSPPGAPGVSPPPIRVETGVKNPVEIVDVAAGTATPVAGLAGIGLLPAWSHAKTPNGAWLVLAGGMDATGAAGKPSAQAAIVELDAGKLKTGDAKVVTGPLKSKRFGGAARFLSTGDIVLTGGSDGEQPSPPELIPFGGDGTMESAVVLEGKWPDAAFKGTAFPAVAVISDDGKQARILVVGGNPVSPQMGFEVPDSPNAWILTLKADGGHYSAAGAEAAPAAGFDKWADRSLASLVPFGASWLLVGGYRDFQPPDKVDGCKDGAAGKCSDCADAWGGFCFFQTVAEFAATADKPEVTLTKVYREKAARLGAAAAVLQDGAVMVFGGVEGFGNPATGGVTPEYLLSSGVIVRAAGAGDDVCAANLPVVP